MTSIVDLQQIVVDEMTGAKTLVVPQIVDDLGEVQYDGFTKHLDSSAYPDHGVIKVGCIDDREVSTKPSQVDTKGYIDTRIVIDKIMRNTPLDVLRIYGDKFAQGDYSSDDTDIDDPNYDEYADHLDEFDYAMDVQGVTEAIAEASSKKEQKSNSGVTANEQAPASEDKETTD